MVKTLERPPVSAAQVPLTSVAALVDAFGDIPLHRIVLAPAPGTAVPDDIGRVRGDSGRVCELIDGTLIEKAVGTESDLIGSKLIGLLQPFAESRGLGWVLGGQGFLRLSGTRLRAADAAVVGYEQVDGDRFPGPSDGGPAYPDLYPDLAVEVLSRDNTDREMQRKREDFFAAGTRLVWQIDPATSSAAVYARDAGAEDPVEELGRAGILDGRDVLPGFSVTVGELLDAVLKIPGA